MPTLKTTTGAMAIYSL